MTPEEARRLNARSSLTVGIVALLASGSALAATAWFALLVTGFAGGVDFGVGVLWFCTAICGGLVVLSIRKIIRAAR